MKDKNIKEWTCECIKDFVFNDMQFRAGREYQVDIYPMFLKVYKNGGWMEYVYFENKELFNEYFKMIDI